MTHILTRTLYIHFKNPSAIPPTEGFFRLSLKDNAYMDDIRRIALGLLNISDDIIKVELNVWDEQNEIITKKDEQA